MSSTGNNMSETLILPERATFGYVTYGPAGQYGPRIQRDIQVFFVADGQCKVSVDSVQIDVEAGEVLLLSPGKRELFRFAGNRPSRHGWCHLEYEAPLPEAAQAIWTVAQVAPPAVAALLDLGAALADHSGQTLLARQIGSALLTATAQSHPSSGPARSLPPAVTRALTLLEHRLDFDWTLDTLAQASGAAPSTLRRLFATHLRQSPIATLWRLRVERGVRLLQSTGLSSAQIAFLCGFKSAEHFSRRVRAHAGEAPFVLRRRHWGA